MKRGWDSAAIPELQGRSTAQQRQLWSAAFRARWSVPGMMPAYSVLLVTFGVCLLGLFLLNGLIPGMLMVVLTPVWGGWWGIIGFTAFYRITAPILRPIVIDLLAAPNHR